MRDCFNGLLIVGAAVSILWVVGQEFRRRDEVRQETALRQMETDITLAGIEAEKERALAGIRYNGLGFVIRVIGEQLLYLAAAIDNLLTPEEQQLQRLQRGTGK